MIDYIDPIFYGSRMLFNISNFWYLDYYNHLLNLAGVYVLKIITKRVNTINDICYCKNCSLYNITSMSKICSNSSLFI